MKFNFDLPNWLHWLVPVRIREDHEKRIDLMGSASSSHAGGIITSRSSKTDEK